MKIKPSAFYEPDYGPWVVQILGLIQNAENEAKILGQDTIMFRKKDVNEIGEILVCILEELNGAKKEVDRLREHILKLGDYHE